MGNFTIKWTGPWTGPYASGTTGPSCPLPASARLTNRNAFAATAPPMQTGETRDFALMGSGCSRSPVNVVSKIASGLEKKPHGRQGRCKKEDDRGTKAEEICMAA